MPAFDRVTVAFELHVERSRKEHTRAGRTSTTRIEDGSVVVLCLMRLDVPRR